MEHAGRKGCYSEREVMGHKRHSSNPEDPRTVNGTVEEIAGLLLRCEDEGVAPRYRSGESDPVRLETGGADIFVVSDLHAAGGRNNSGVFGGTENFYADVAFRRFLDHAHHSLDGKSGVVVINGDFVDFLRIVSVPEPGEIGIWRQMLREVGIHKEKEALASSISPDEREKYGLKTHDFKSVWKLHTCLEGHADLFDGLAEWLKRGHNIVLVKGNHDLEWYWPAVRNTLRLSLAKRISLRTRKPLMKILTKVVLPRLTFIDDALILDQDLYIEHGHRYDKFSHVRGGPLWGDRREELNIPFGSFINRYLLNTLELVYPYLDNVRPAQNILHLLMRERFFLGLKILFCYVPFTVHMIPKRYAHYMFKPLVSYLLVLGLPLLVVLLLFWQRIGPLFGAGSAAVTPTVSDIVVQYFLGMLKDGALLFLSYVGARFVSWVQLEEPASLFSGAKELFLMYPGCRYFTMGHTHNPEQLIVDGQWYVNTSTWIPIVESSSAALREDRTYAVLRFARDHGGKITIHPLQRWNDDACRWEELVVVENK